jgi:hypothetical protein
MEGLKKLYYILINEFVWHWHSKSIIIFTKKKNTRKYEMKYKIYDKYSITKMNNDYEMKNL